MELQSIQTTFTSGEISPLLEGRADLDRYKSGAKTMLNAYALPHGAVKRRVGTHFVAEVRNSARPARVIEHVTSQTIATILVFNDGFIQFVRNGDFIETSPGVRYEISHPYADNELADITYSQSGTAMYMCHTAHAPVSITRTSDTSWALSTVSFTYNAKTDKDFISAYVNVTIQAGTTAFSKNDEFIITIDGSGGTTITGTRTGNGNINITKVNSVAYNKTITFKCLAEASTKTDQLWSAKEGTNTIVAEWSPANYPAAVTFYDQRLYLAGIPDQPHAIWGSMIGDPENLTIGVDSSDAIKITIGADKYDRIMHLKGTRQLLVFTYGGEYSATGGINTGITPTNIKISSQTTYGTANVTPQRVGSEVLFTQRGGRIVRAIAYDAIQDSNTAPDVTIISEHITKPNIVDIAYSQSPDQVIWAVRSDGALLSLTHIREQDVTAWARHTTGASGLFKSVAVIPEGVNDNTYVVVDRVVNGVSKLYVEYFDYITTTAGIIGAQTDCCVTGTAGTPTDTWAGFDHLEGESIAVVADNKVHPNVTVSSGTITLGYVASSVQAGVPYNTTITLEHPEPVIDRSVSARINKMRIDRVLLQLKDTVNVSISQNDKNGNVIRSVPIPSFNAGDTMDTAPVPFSGVKELAGIGWQSPNNITIEQTTPMPFTLLSVLMQVTMNQRAG